MSPSMEFKHAITAQQAGVSNRGGLRVTEAHHRWMALPEDERKPTPKALEHMLAVTSGSLKRPRDKRISASSLGDPCTRRIVFGFYDAPKLPESHDSQDLMDGGSWLHLKWQVEGLSAGWLKEAETFFYDEHWRVGGSTDGIMYGPAGQPDELFELKTVGEWVYKRIQKDGAPMPGHQLQVEGYFLLSGMKRASIVYVNRASGAMTEFRYDQNPVRRAELEAILNDWHESLDRFLHLNTLPDMLEECEQRTGWTYLRCPYREFCPAAEKVGLALRGRPRVPQGGVGLPGDRGDGAAEGEGDDTAPAAEGDGGLVRGPGAA